jgi:hypothetical protein
LHTVSLIFRPASAARTAGAIGSLIALLLSAAALLWSTEGGRQRASTSVTAFIP